LASLIALDGELRGRRFALDHPVLVGRGPYNHVVLDDTRISRQHAKIAPEAQGHVVYDLNSANGTYVNDQQVKRQRLSPNDILRFGPFSFRFEGEETERPTDKRGRFVEVHTAVGFEPPSKIVDSLDAALATNPGLLPDLSALEDADRKLRTLYGFTQSIASTLEQGTLVERIVNFVLDTFPEADTAVLYLLDAGDGTMQPFQIKRRGDGPPSHITLPPQFQEEVVTRSRSVLSVPFAPAASAAATGKRGKRSARGLSMHAPLVFNGRVEGVLMVRGADENAPPFRQYDLDLLTGMASQAAMALSNARYHLDSLKRQRLEQDLQLAQEIQQSFLPRALPQPRGIRFVTEYSPAYSVGGDFYDVFWLNYDRIGMFIGDVSGKGVAAALLMARISSDLRLAAMVEPSPGRVLEHVNRIVLERRQPDIFVTVLYLTFDLPTRVLTIANAGHLPPLIRPGPEGAVQRIDTGVGTPIGIFDDSEYDQVTVKLAEGDTVVLCTDGVPEATNPGGEQFGLERLEAILKAGSSNPRALARRLLGALRQHAGAAQQYDDLTLIVCGVLPDGEEDAEPEAEFEETTATVTAAR
jgi:serine phosphatase RsbU (regulator of sigma subunit)